MSAIAEARGWSKRSDEFWSKAAAETDPQKKAAFERKAQYWSREAVHAWDDARSEADADAAYDRDHMHDPVENDDD